MQGPDNVVGAPVGAAVEPQDAPWDPAQDGGKVGMVPEYPQPYGGPVQYGGPDSHGAQVA